MEVEENVGRDVHQRLRIVTPLSPGAP
jgi:hypothetical protein